VRHTHKEVAKPDLDAWIRLYGSILGDSRFCKTGDYENDVYSARVRLEYLIPEYLPIKGKRARVYYHGIAPFCIACNNTGHVKVECNETPVSWSEYIEALKDTGIPDSYFEPTEASYTPNNSSNGSQFFSSTPRNGSQAAFLRTELQSIIHDAIAAATNGAIANANVNSSVQNPTIQNNLNQSQNQVPVPPSLAINPTVRPRTRASLANLSSQSQSVPGPSGQNQLQFQAQAQAQAQAQSGSRYRGRTPNRGRGRGTNPHNFDPDIPPINQGYGFGGECAFRGVDDRRENPEERLIPFPTHGPVGQIRFNRPTRPGRGRGRGYY
jgi:hypothetical protein